MWKTLTFWPTIDLKCQCRTSQKTKKLAIISSVYWQKPRLVRGKNNLPLHHFKQHVQLCDILPCEDQMQQLVLTSWMVRKNKKKQQHGSHRAVLNESLTLIVSWTNFLLIRCVWRNTPLPDWVINTLMQLCTEVPDFSHWAAVINIHGLRRRLPPRSGMNMYERNLPGYWRR